MKKQGIKFLSDKKLENYECDGQISIFDYEKERKLIPGDVIFYVGNRIYLDCSREKKIIKNFGIHRLKIDKIEGNKIMASSGSHFIILVSWDEKKYFFRTRSEADQEYCRRIGRKEPEGSPILGTKEVFEALKNGEISI